MLVNIGIITHALHDVVTLLNHMPQVVELSNEFHLRLYLIQYTQKKTPCQAGGPGVRYEGYQYYNLITSGCQF
jgi:hypothetical protein